ncbi:glucose PTS transporter subunit IIA [Pengzhenrongella sp.]|jgi:PTS system beta-glucosides-specific IIC component|uniref:glucose PTS transporter subunit IIA n=1 Tax=Pengzhenrongella sp. TaxID=2888820 RepID=UPI002F9345AE
MSSTTQRSTAEGIVAEIGGPGNIVSLTHCATRLRFELNDSGLVDQKAVEAIPGVMGAVPQSGDRFQVVIGGAVQNTFNQIMNLPEMASIGKSALSDADVKAGARGKARGKVAWVDGFFEYLSDSFRPLLGVLLGASLIIAFTAVLDALHIVDFRATDKSATWIFVDAMWRSVFYFLPIMVAYNAAKKLNIDPWVGATVMGAMMTPEFVSLSDTKRFADTVCTTNPVLGTQSCVAHIFGLPMQLNGYGGQVFVPLIMVAVLALVYKGLKKIFPENIQMVFVPFFSMTIMIPATAFLIGPMGIWLGNGLGTGMAWMNGHAPILFAIIIPLIYPFLVPLGLHWPLNALMLINIQTLGYDFIQGPMGAWNFACFGATAGVLFISMRDKETEMRGTATGALLAGLLGGISEPSLYGIHLRFKRIYPRMLVGCLVGGLITGIFGGVKTSAFAFTSLLTIPVFSPMPLYAISIAAAFVTAMVLVIISDYRTPEQKAESLANRKQAESDLALEVAQAGMPKDVPTAASTPTAVIAAPVAGHVVSLDEVEDKVFASRALGEGVGIQPTDGRVVSPVAGLLVTVPASGHAFGIKTDDRVEVLVHIGIDTVRLQGKCFEVAVKKGQRVAIGDLLATVDLEGIREAGYDPTTVVVVINSKTLSSVTPKTGSNVIPGDPIIDVTP